MNAPPPMTLAGWLQFALVLALAGILRVGYVTTATEMGSGVPALAVQGGGWESPAGREPAVDQPKPRGALDSLVQNLTANGAYSAQAPLSDADETTAHVAPGYPYLIAQISRLDENPEMLLRWLQCVLGSLTAGIVFLFCRRAFNNEIVALVAGVLAALHPFWIINTAELNDGVLAAFLLAASLALGTRGAQSGGAFTSLLLGLSLAMLAMVRAALLPFGLVGLLWFLYQCKHVRHGWFNAILAFLGFANGLAPWAVRNWNAFAEPVPITTTAYLDLWTGNNPHAHGGPFDEATLRKSLSEERLKELLDEPNQAKRYARLGQDVLAQVSGDPAAVVAHRWQASLKFILGHAWFTNQRMSVNRQDQPESAALAPPEWLAPHVELWLQGFLLALVVLAFLGWRWSQAWKINARMATLALLWAPLPYVLTHAEALSGPRLPWDTLLICYAAYAIGCLSPQTARSAEPA